MAYLESNTNCNDKTEDTAFPLNETMNYTLKDETQTASKLVNKNSSNEGENEQQDHNHGSGARGRRHASVRSRDNRPKMERVIDQLRQRNLDYEQSDWDSNRWRHVEDRRFAVGNIFEDKQLKENYHPGHDANASLHHSSSRNLYSVSHQSQNVQLPPKLPPIETSMQTTSHGMKLSDNMLKSMVKYHMNVGRLLHNKAPHNTDSSTIYQDLGRSPQSSIESISLRKDRSSSQHRCSKVALPTPHVDEFGPPPPKEEYQLSSKHSMHRRWNQHTKPEASLPKFSRFAVDSGGSLPQTLPNEVKMEKVPSEKPEEVTVSKPALPKVVTRDRGVQVTLILGSPLRLARTYGELDESSSPSVITQICAVDTRKKGGNTFDVKKPSLYSTHLAASSVATSVLHRKTNSVVSMRPTNSVAYYIYNMKHREVSDKRSIGNMVQNFFDLGSQRSSVRLRDTVIGEVSDVSSESSAEHQYRIVRQKVKKNPRAGLNCLRLLYYDMKLWWKRLQKRQEDNPIFLEQIKAIEGQFGSGIVSFFVFLRWLISLNVLFACVWLLFIVFPHIGAFHSENNATFYVIDIFTGEGALKDSWLFYGSYTEMVGVYPLALLYLLAIVVTFFGGFFIVLRSLACAIEDEGVNLKGTRYTFLSLVFSAWDYSLTSPEAAKNLSLGIANTFRIFVHL